MGRAWCCWTVWTGATSKWRALELGELASDVRRDGRHGLRRLEKIADTMQPDLHETVLGCAEQWGWETSHQEEARVRRYFAWDSNPESLERVPVVKVTYDYRRIKVEGEDEPSPEPFVSVDVYLTEATEEE